MNTKIFLNMVIHDMRNPTNSIEYALKEVLKMINNFTQEKNSLKFNSVKVTPNSRLNIHSGLDDVHASNAAGAP